MHAFAQDLFRFRDMRIGKLGKREIGLPRKTSYCPRNQLFRVLDRLAALQRLEAQNAAGNATRRRPRTSAGSRIITKSSTAEISA